MNKCWFFTILIITFSCRSTPNRTYRKVNIDSLKQESIQSNQSESSTTKTVDNSIHFHDSLTVPGDLTTFSRDLENTYWIPKDTITKNGNYINYLMSNDSCCSDNIYIKWGNDSINRIEIAQAIRQFRTYFTPKIKFETKDYLILEHGCGTDCWAILFLPLNNYEKVHHILDIVKYNPINYTVVCSLENYQDVNGDKFIEAVNVKTGQKKQITFKNYARAARPLFLIDSCIITDDEIYIRAKLSDRKTNEPVTEVIRLQNDIK